MKTYKRFPYVLLALVALSVFVFGAAWMPQSAAAAQLADGSNNEINWTSLELCAAMGPANCEAIEDTWNFTAPADGTVTVEFAAVSTNTGPDRNEVVDYSTSNGLSGRLGTVPPLPNTAQVEYEVMEGDQISGTFTHAPKEPGRKGGSLKVRVSGTFEPAPLPVDPICQSLGVVPASGYAPLSVRFGGTWSDPDGLVANAFVLTGDGGSVELADQATGASYEYLNAGEYTAQLVLVTEDGRELSSEACQASVEASEPPVLDFQVMVDASCQDHTLAGWIEGYASQEATLEVTASVLGSELGGSKQVGPGTFEFSAEKGGFEGLVPVTISASLMYEGEVVAEAEFSETLDCGTTPAPEPGQCVAAAVDVTNVPDSGAYVNVTAQVVGNLAKISVNGQEAGEAVPTNGTATFNVFVKPEDVIVVIVRGEDGVWATSPACQITITGVEAPKCGNGPSKLDVVAFIDSDFDNYLDEGEEIVVGGDWGFQLQTNQRHYMASRHDRLPEWTNLEQGTLIYGVAVMHPQIGAYNQMEPAVWVRDRSPLDGLDSYHWYPGENREHGLWTPFSALVVDRQAGVLRVERCDDIIIAVPLQYAESTTAVETAVEAVAEPVYSLNTDGTYTVTAGDTLSGIAYAFGQDWSAMAEWNNLEVLNGNIVVLSIGQTLAVTPPTG